MVVIDSDLCLHTGPRPPINCSLWAGWVYWDRSRKMKSRPLASEAMMKVQLWICSQTYFNLQAISCKVPQRTYFHCCVSSRWRTLSSFMLSSTSRTSAPIAWTCRAARCWPLTNSFGSSALSFLYPGDPFYVFHIFLDPQFRLRLSILVDRPDPSPDPVNNHPTPRQPKIR